MRHGRTKKLTIEPGLNKEVGGLLLWNRGSETAHLNWNLPPRFESGIEAPHHWQINLTMPGANR